MNTLKNAGRRVLITGGAGFIGSNFVRSAYGGTSSLIILDALTYAGNRAT